MVNLGKTFFHVRQALTRALASEARAGPVEPPPALPAREPAAQGAPPLTSEESEPQPAGEEHREFSEFLQDLGAEPGPTSALERKGQELEQLRRSLEMLRPLGDELARVEQLRLAEQAEHEARVADLRRQVEAALEAGRAEAGRLADRLARLSEALSKKKQALARSEDARKSLRARFEERKRLAAERWHELRRLKQRIRELERGPPG